MNIDNIARIILNFLILLPKNEIYDSIYLCLTDFGDVHVIRVSGPGCGEGVNLRR